jgi:hypothetical protein
LSSTTRAGRPRRDAESGQVIILFAGALLVILLIAAITFDVGQNLLDRRTEQNVSDASALAGARYLPGAAYTYHGPCSTAPSGYLAVKAACDLAVESGYQDGVASTSVRVDLPPIAPSPFANLRTHIQVSIGRERPSFFAGVVGAVTQRTAAMAVATNASDIALPYSLLALDPHGCATNKITGSPGSQVVTDGTVHVDSDCGSEALLLSGNGVLTAPQCDVVGTIHTTNSATNNCTTAPTGVLASGDPLKMLPEPSKPGLAAAVLPVGLPAGEVPAACPGGTSPATEDAPAACSFNSGGPNGTNGKTYRLSPGYYPGGIRTSNATLLLSPGIYWIGGGGLQVQSDGRIISRAIGDDGATSTPSGGVLIYNTADPLATIVSGCVSTPTGAGCYQPITLNGNTGAALSLLPMQSGDYQGMVIFIDRTLAAGGGFDIDLNGAGSTLILEGTVYAATGTVKLNGSDSTSQVEAQLICWSFQVNGSGPGLTINYSPDNLFHVRGTGLVE